MSSRIPLAYSFGNHMHWVDMQWLWGYHVLPGSVRDMLNLIAQTGAKGNINFEGVGYEKLAAEDPESLQALRQAVAEGKIEPVGCSYGQPYGLFHGGESNIRQRIYGARSVRRLLGVWPQTFWEEEFDFFPQLPQILDQTGFKYASLYFQWTWHTPEVPVEPHSAVLWEGIDGTRLVTAPRNNLNLHQWPEDFQLLLDDLAAKGPQEVLGTPISNNKSTEENPAPPLILQWLELMPSPDWMCRTEVLRPKLQELLDDDRFEVTCHTLGEYLSTQDPATLPVRPYSLDQTWHGLTLGKNGDRLRQTSAQVESKLLAAESLATTLSLFGRPYPQWDVYPTWELEEAWRHLLMAQHHDNDECEGLCGDIGRRDYFRAENYALDTYNRSAHVQGSLFQDETTPLRFNPLAWPIQHSPANPPIPPLGWRICNPEESEEEPALIPLPIQGYEKTWPQITFQQNGTPYSIIGEPENGSSISFAQDAQEKIIVEIHKSQFSKGQNLFLSYRPDLIEANSKTTLPPIDPGFAGALKLPIPLDFPIAKIITASPYAVHEYEPHPVKRLRKYPTGDWMTSDQWFEEVPEAFTSANFVDFVAEDGTGLLVTYSGTRQWLLIDGVPNIVLSAYDPWDENNYDVSISFDSMFYLHGSISHADRYRYAQEQTLNQAYSQAFDNSWHPHLPETFGPLNLTSDTDGVVATAFYRETEDFSGKHVENYAGTGIGYPTVLRLVEFNGEPAEVTLQLAGPVAKAYKTNLLGQIQEELAPSPCPTPDYGHPFEWSELRFPMKPREILTLYLDIVPARKQARDLDAKREIWATVHRV